MGQLKNAPPVRLICAVCCRDEESGLRACAELERLYGPVAERTVSFAFTHTRYYQEEMGPNLQKYFCAFGRLIEPMQIVGIKLATNRIEAEMALAGRRSVNLDPGYIEAAKLVLATTKNYGHRIYLGQGIYGDVQLFWRGGRFQSNPWTYPDYLEASALEFFSSVRQDYLKEGKP